MSSVGSSDNQSNRSRDESVRNAREEYKKKESSLVRKHQVNLKRVNEQHLQELENVKKNHQAQMKNLKNQTTLVQKKRDNKFQNQINELRGMHRKQLEEISSSNANKLDVLKSQNEKELARFERQKESRINQVASQSEREVENLKERYARGTKEIQDSQRKALRKQRSKMVDQHETERQVLTDSYRKSKLQTDRAFKDYRETTQSQLKDQEVRHLSDKARMSENSIAQIQRDRESHENVTLLMKAGFDESMEKQRDRFHRQRRSREEADSLSRTQLKSTVAERINTQVRGLEQENKRLENRNVIDTVKQKKQAEIEKSNIRRDYQMKLENAQDNEKKAIQQANMSNREDILEVHDEASKHMQKQSRFYLDKMHTENSKNRQAINTIETNFSSRIQQTNANADARVDTILNNETAKTEALKKRFDESRTSIKEQHREDLQVIRDNFVKDRNTAIRNLKEKMNDREIAHGQKIQSMRTEYEKRLADLQDQKMKSERQDDKYFKKTFSDIKRVHSHEMDTQNMRHSDQMAELKKSHKDEISSLNKRHEEQLNRVLNTVRKS